MISNNDFKAIAELDLDPIKVKLMHKESGEGWSLEYANSVEAEYRRFLYLMKMFPNESASPLFDVDIFWHYHILDTLKYAVDCDLVFGYFLHHFPYVGLRGEEDEVNHVRAGVRMQVLYESTFGESYLRAMPGAPETQPASPPTASAIANKAAFSYVPNQKSVAVASKTAFSYVPSPQAIAVASQTAFSYVPNRDAIAVANKTAFSYVPDQEAIAVANKTAFSYVPTREAIAVANKTAFSYVPSREAIAVANKTAFSYVPSQTALAVTGNTAFSYVPATATEAFGNSPASANLALLHPRYLDRPVLAAV